MNIENNTPSQKQKGKKESSGQGKNTNSMRSVGNAVDLNPDKDLLGKASMQLYDLQDIAEDELLMVGNKKLVIVDVLEDNGAP